jgi:hypothetical protein
MIGYLRTIKNYFNTAKGKHDLVDYIRAGFAILVTTMILNFILRLI